MLDPAILVQIIPGAERVTRAPDGIFTATLGFGVGLFRGRQTILLRVERETLDGLTVSGRATGPFGAGQAIGRINLHPEGDDILVIWRFDGTVRGPFTLAGPLLLRLTATAFTGRVLANLRRVLEGHPERPSNTDLPSPPRARLKALLAAAPLEGIDLDRDRNLGRDVDL